MEHKHAKDGSASHSTIALSLSAPESPVRRPFGRLRKAAPPPLEHASLLAVVVGACATANAASALLQAPNAEATGLRDELQLLCVACIAEYEKRPGCIDSLGGLEGRLRAHPAWALLSQVGSIEAATEHPAITAAGVELLLSFHHQKPMATAFCNGARIALQADELIGIGLESLLAVQDGEKVPHWIKHARATFAEFLSIFDAAPPRPLPTRSFEERARTELACRAAFASYRRRAGILDDTCFSRRQIAEAVAYMGAGVFRSPAERAVAMWLVGCSGLYATSVQFIPFATACADDWVFAYDLNSGILRRDFRCLAADAARPRPGSSAPASFVALTPAPVDVRDEIQRCANATANPCEMGDVIPALRQIGPRDLVYPDLSDLSPSFARWSRTLAPFALQVGIDTLLAGITNGDLGVTARSKVHYCLVDLQEQWLTASALYAAVGWERPVPMPATGLPFGAAVVATSETLRQLDEELCRWVEKVRPPKRLASEGQLLEFHNRFVRALAWRLAVWISLRPAAELSLRASVDDRRDLCVDLTEKTSAGRAGALPAVICDAMRSALINYRAHCAALLDRLKTFGWSGPVVQWLTSVGKHEDVPLLGTIHSPKQLTPLGMDELRKVLPGTSELAPDWGRKYAENHLRRAGAQSRDIDRHQRHEVLGQEQDTAVADGTEVEWVRRLKPTLDAMSRSLFPTPLYGLRKGG